MATKQTDSGETAIIKKGLSILIVILIPVLLAVVLLFCYDLYMQHLNRINRKIDVEASENNVNKKGQPRIKRLFFLKYTHLSAEDKEIKYLLEEVKIDNCKYIILSKEGETPSIIHANDCEFCLDKYGCKDQKHTTK